MNECRAVAFTREQLKKIMKPTSLANPALAIKDLEKQYQYSLDRVMYCHVVMEDKNGARYGYQFIAIDYIEKLEKQGMTRIK